MTNSGIATTIDGQRRGLGCLCQNMINDTTMDSGDNQLIIVAMLTLSATLEIDSKLKLGNMPTRNVRRTPVTLFDVNSYLGIPVNVANVHVTTMTMRFGRTESIGKYAEL